MRTLLSKRLEKVKPSGIRQVNDRACALEATGKHVIHLEIGRPDFTTPEYIKEACTESLKNGNVFYTSNYGLSELRKTIAYKLEAQNHLHYNENEVLITCGLSEAVYDVCAAILEAGDEVLIPDPVWGNYRNIPPMFGAETVTYNLFEKNGFQPEIEEIEKKISSRTKAIVIISPHNPTGSVLEREVLEKIAEIAVKKDIAVISDEIYERIMYDGQQHCSIAEFPGMKERTFVLNGFSKAYAMTGWRLGYVASSAEMIRAVNKVHQHNTTCAASFVQTAGIAAIREESDEVGKMVDEYQRRRNYMVEAINHIPGLECLCPKGAFYIFMNIKKLNVSSQVFSDLLLKEEFVATVPGDVFGEGGKGYIRISYASSMEDLVQAGKSMRKIADYLRSAAKTGRTPV